MVVVSLLNEPLEQPPSRLCSGPSTAQVVVLLPPELGPPQHEHPTLLKKAHPELQHLVATTHLKETLVNNSFSKFAPVNLDHCSLLRRLSYQRPGL